MVGCERRVSIRTLRLPQFYSTHSGGLGLRTAARGVSDMQQGYALAQLRGCDTARSVGLRTRIASHLQPSLTRARLAHGHHALRVLPSIQSCKEPLQLAYERQRTLKVTSRKPVSCSAASSAAGEEVPSSCRTARLSV